MPPTDDRRFTIYGNSKSFEDPVLNCRGSTTHRGYYHPWAIFIVQSDSPLSVGKNLSKYKKTIEPGKKNVTLELEL